VTSPDRQLDNPVWHSLSGRHRDVATGSDLARIYPADMSPFFAMPASPTTKHWEAARMLAQRPDPVLLHQDATVPPDWTQAFSLDVVQMIAAGSIGDPDPRAAPLGPRDLPAMLALVAAAKPAPFGPKTPLFGGYHGIWADGALIAMAGERLHVDGWTEISAVATSPVHRGEGLASAVIRTVAAIIEARGEHAFLHVVHSNRARGLYEHLGFQERRHTPVRGLTYTSVEK
jgi:ribosomal protein S18 acetylase RimI-like enzyme